ncbi:hypothetical protein [Photobacterium damselae]|uniref:hypothetical protein n=1 Tax=Photobacterium damselae TaxID=38293 RepID=UPI001EE030D9|nr:hypothetical protein [Photobacterium damselae]MCG3846600.1 hypothetical protein [Photobacterium damselae]
MNKKIILSSILLSIGSLTSIAAVADTDYSSATITWSGISSVIPGSKVVITGENGAITPNKGELDVRYDGVFSTATPVVLESRTYDDKTGAVGDMMQTTWTLSKDPIKVNWGKNATAGMDVKVKDINTGTELKNGEGVASVSTVSLSVENSNKLANAPVDPNAVLSVQANVLATVVDPA